MKSASAEYRLRRRTALRQIAAGVTLIALPAVATATVYLSAQEAVALIFPGQSFEHLSLSLDKTQLREIERRGGLKVRNATLDVWRSAQGTVFIDRVTGKHELITYACGINPDGSVKQVEILEYLEVYGGEIRDARWRAQFVGKRAGADFKLDEDIRNISGATLSCRHVTEGIRRLLATYEVALNELAPRAALARDLC